MALDGSERPLGATELVQWRNGEASPFQVVIVATVEGELADDDPRRGLVTLQAARPLSGHREALAEAVLARAI